MPLEGQLDPKLFFRASRKQIINLRWVKGLEQGFDGAFIAELIDAPEVKMSRRQPQKFNETTSMKNHHSVGSMHRQVTKSNFPPLNSHLRIIGGAGSHGKSSAPLAGANVPGKLSDNRTNKTNNGIRARFILISPSIYERSGDCARRNRPDHPQKNQPRASFRWIGIWI